MKCYTIDEGRLIHYDGFSMGYAEFENDTLQHTHAPIEMVYVVSGHGEHIINGKVFTVKRGSMIIMDCNSIHEIRVWDTIQSYSIMFRASFLSDKLDVGDRLKKLLEQYYNFSTSESCFKVDLTNNAELKMVDDLFFAMLSEGINNNDRCERVTRGYLDSIINIMLRNVDAPKESDVDVVMTDIMSYIRKHSCEPLSLSEVSERFNYKSEYLSKKLKSYCGMSFKQLLMRQRLTNVIDDLMKTDDSIDQIIQRNGFTNKTYFYSVFSKTYGVKPKYMRDYRNNYIKYIELKTKYKDMPK